ncbi:hypothetical protein ACFQE1_04325 [Halobium palmae]|uniref:Uncharacterized protein n=1 Tax=Halobium palmae TaxID=1776492 RepID=A0ABD5RWC9_9EURY
MSSSASGNTTLAVREEIADRLWERKRSRTESYNDVLERLLNTTDE